MLSDRTSYLLLYRFRWVFCQLEVLRHCFPASIRRTLDQLPQSLDETYVRVLSQISQMNQAHAHRMLQCLLVAVRPLRVEELAELLAFEFDEEQRGIPKYRAAWRLDDQTQAVLSTCSSLVTIVDDKTDWYFPQRRRRQVVQFSHFSVKEFLLSNRLTSSISRYRIFPESAHTILAQACIGFLLHLDEDIDEESTKGFPLADYAARNWVEHVKHKDVSSRVKDGMETLFDPDKPYFAAWIGIHDIDEVDIFIPPEPSPRSSYRIPSRTPSLTSFRTLPLPSLPPVSYSAALTGVHDKDDVDEMFIRPEPSHRGSYRTFPLPSIPPVSYSAAWIGMHDKDEVNKIFIPPEPSHRGSSRTSSRTPSLASFLTLPLPSIPPVFQPIPLPPDSESYSEPGGSPNPGSSPRPNPLYYSALCGFYNLAKHLVVKFPQYVNATYGRYEFPLLAALCEDHLEVGRLLLEHGAKVDAQETTGRTVLLKVISQSHHSGLADIVTLLLEHGADVNFKDRNFTSALHMAEYYGELEVARILLKYKADFNCRDANGNTPLHILLPGPGIYNEGDILDHVRLLSKYGADMNSQNNRSKTPLHFAIKKEWFTLARILIEHGANAQAEDDYGTTPLHLLSASLIHDSSALDLVWLLLGHGAEVNSQDKNKQTPLLLAMGQGWFKLAWILLQRGADANAEDNNGKTPLHMLSKRHIYGDDDSVLQSPPYRYADNNLHDAIPMTRFHSQHNFGPVQIAQALLDHGANVNAGNNLDEDPSYRGLEGNFVFHAIFSVID